MAEGDEPEIGTYAWSLKQKKLEVISIVDGRHSDKSLDIGQQESKSVINRAASWIRFHRLKPPKERLPNSKRYLEVHDALTLLTNFFHIAFDEYSFKELDDVEKFEFVFSTIEDKSDQDLDFGSIFSNFLKELEVFTQSDLKAGELRVPVDAFRKLGYDMYFCIKNYELNISKFDDDLDKAQVKFSAQPNIFFQTLCHA